MKYHDKLQRYYKFQAPIYDLTRWAFLFGRRHLPQWVRNIGQPKRILEIGCGTGANLAALAKAFPESELTGVDLSEPMLFKAHQRLRPLIGNRLHLLKAPFHSKLFHDDERFDLILCSYALSMMDDARSTCIREIEPCLTEQGNVMILDFLETPVKWFQDWMEINHVRMDVNLIHECVSAYEPVFFQKYPAYGGFWSYFQFVGSPRQTFKANRDGKPLKATPNNALI